jgi:hypothetical protein
MKKSCTAIASIAAVLLSNASVHALPEERRLLRRIELQTLPCSVELKSVTCGPDKEFFYNLCQAIKSGYSEDECQSSDSKRDHELSAAAARSAVVDLERDHASRTCGSQQRPVLCDDLEFFNFCQASLYGRYRRTQCRRLYYG